MRENSWIGASASCRTAACAWRRSEEHTSELQSHLNLVCRLLLEKKKETGEAIAFMLDERNTTRNCPGTPGEHDGIRPAFHRVGHRATVLRPLGRHCDAARAGSI